MYMKNNVGIIILVLVVTMLPLNVFADSVNNKNLVDMANAYNEEYLANEVLEKEGYIVIDTLEKADQVRKEDVEKLTKERNEKLSKIPDYLIRKYNLFLKDRIDLESNYDKVEFYSIKDNVMKVNEVDEEENLLKFKKFCNDQRINSMDDDILIEDLTILKNTTVEDMILAYFSSNDYPISYGMFLHSLTSNPKNLYYNIEGVSAYKVSCGDMSLSHTFAYEFLQEKDFIKMIYDFAKAGSYEENRDGFHYEFNRGDLKYSIHGTTNMRLHRKTTGKTYFRIWDVYDFDDSLAKFLEWTTTTNNYGITIEGSYQWN